MRAVPITPEAFAPFGQVLQAPAGFGRDYFNDALANSRPMATPSLSLTHARRFAEPRLMVSVLERHEYSSQSFIPINVSRYLVIVAPHRAGGGPDAERAQAFLMLPHQGVTYAQNVWHHSLTVLDADATLAVVMWTDPAGGDEEFVSLDKPFEVTWETHA